MGAARLAAVVSPIAGSTEHAVDACYGVGYTNAAGCGSTAFCGVQFASDGAVLWEVGSKDMVATCNARAALWVSATDLATSASCGSASYAVAAR